MSMDLDGFLPLNANRWAWASLFGAVLWLTAASANAETTEWQLEVEDLVNEITVHTRQVDNYYTQFRGVTRMRTSLSSLVALLRDVENMPQWAYRTKLAMRLESISSREAVIYSVAGLTWPFKDRDLIVRTRLQQDPMTLAVTVTGEAAPDYLPPDPAYVRVPFLKSSWEFVPVGAGVVEVRFQGYGDPGGTLSSSLLNWFSQQVIWEAPLQTLIGLRRVVKQARYQQASLSIIREPGASATASSGGELARLVNDETAFNNMAIVKVTTTNKRGRMRSPLAHRTSAFYPHRP